MRWLVTIALAVTGHSANAGAQTLMVERTLEFDLAEFRLSATTYYVELAIPRGTETEGTVQVLLANRIPTREYGLSGYCPGALDGKLDVTIPAASAFTADPEADASGCSALAAARRSIAAALDEKEVAARLRELEETIPRNTSPCAGSSVESLRAATRSGPHALAFRGPGSCWIWITRAGPAGIKAPSVYPPGERRGPASWSALLGIVRERLPRQARTESEWLTRETALAVADLVARASSSRYAARLEGIELTKGAAPWEPAFRAEVAKQGVTFAATPSVWAPSAYTDLAGALVWALERPAAPGPVAPSLVNELLSPTPEKLARLNVELSRRLGATFTDPLLHEQSALLLGSLALREAAGPFSDSRWTLSQMTAHLALAEAFRRGGPKSMEGRLADALLAGLAGNEREALAALSTMGDDLPMAWRRALRLRVTGDYREIDRLQSPSPLERRELLRAVELHGPTSSAVALLESRDPDASADWGHLVLEGSSSDLGEIRTYVVDLEKRDIADLEAVWRAEGYGPLPKDLVGVLNTPLKEVAAPFRVIPAGAWCAFARRHVLHSAYGRARVYEGLGLPDPGRAELDRIRKSWGGLREFHSYAMASAHVAYGFLKPQGAEERRLRDSLCAPLREIAESAPERLTAAVWIAGEWCQTLPPAYEWFLRPLPSGTRYDAAPRISLLSDRSSLGKALEGAPSSAAIANRLLELPGAAWAPDKIRLQYGQMLDYNIGAIQAAAAKTDDDEFRLSLLDRHCALEPEACFALGDALHWLDRAPAAVMAYERAVKGSYNVIQVSHSCAFLLDYYLDQGREADALKLAGRIADVYSAYGLESAGRVYERLGRYDQAAALYSAISARYENRSALDRFHARHELRSRDGRYRREGEAVIAELFPEGLKRVTLAELLADPADASGAPYQRASEIWTRQLERSLGLQRDDFIVALGGYRVSDDKQVRLVIGLSDSQIVHLIVRRNGSYLELTGRWPHVKYGPP